MIFCRYFKQQKAGLDFPPFPGEKGEEIYQHISQEAWQLWLQQQTRLINEKQLNMFDAKTRDYLLGQMDIFFSGGVADDAEGFRPLDSSAD
jgi:Fe-S cluster biosynthesis and repair protein YggX